MANTRKAAAAKAAKVEAFDETHEVEFDGETYMIPPSSQWSISAIEAYEDGKVVTMVRAILGTEQWERFKRKPRTAADLGSLFEAMQEALGLEGN